MTTHGRRSLLNNWCEQKKVQNYGVGRNLKSLGFSCMTPLSTSPLGLAFQPTFPHIVLPAHFSVSAHFTEKKVDQMNRD